MYLVFIGTSKPTGNYANYSRLMVAIDDKRSQVCVLALRVSS